MNKLPAIKSAYEKLEQQDKDAIDAAVKSILDHVENLNRPRRASSKAILRFSPDNALELLASIGIKLSGKVWPEPEE